MKLFTFDAKFEVAGRDPTALENLLAWHLRVRNQFVAVIAIFVCLLGFVFISGSIFTARVLHFLNGKAAEMKCLLGSTPR